MCMSFAFINKKTSIIKKEKFFLHVLSLQCLMSSLDSMKFLLYVNIFDGLEVHARLFLFSYY